MASHESECVYIARIVCIVLGCTGVERRRASRRHKMVLIIACECHWHSAFGHLQHPPPASMSSKLYSPEDGHRTTTTIRPPAHRQRLVYLWETDAAGSSSSLVKIPLGSRWLLSGWVAGDEQTHTYTLCTPRVKQWRRITRLISHAGGTFLSRLTASGLIVGAFVVYRSVYESHTTYSLA